MAEAKAPTERIEREYIIPLRRKWSKTARYKRANKTVKEIKEFLARHMKVRDRDLDKIKLDKHLNEFVWARGIRNPPIRVKVKAFREGEIIRAELAELSEKMKFKKDKIERRNKKATEVATKSKVEEEKPKEEKGEEEVKKEEEKKASVVEEGKELAKEQAKGAKHQTKVSKQPKRQFRQALQK